MNGSLVSFLSDGLSGGDSSHVHPGSQDWWGADARCTLAPNDSPAYKPGILDQVYQQLTPHERSPFSTFFLLFFPRRGWRLSGGMAGAFLQSWAWSISQRGGEVARNGQDGPRRGGWWYWALCWWLMMKNAMSWDNERVFWAKSQLNDPVEAYLIN